MSMRTVVVLLVLLALGVFVVANWGAFTSPTSLSLIAGTIEAPLGIVMLGITAAIAALFLAYAFYLHASTNRESRRLSRDLQAQRDLAERAEASRLVELRSGLEARLDRVSGACSTIQQSMVDIAARLRDLDERIGATGPEAKRTTSQTGVAEASGG